MEKSKTFFWSFMATVLRLVGWDPCGVCCIHIPACYRLRKMWQKRKCSVQNCYLTIAHGTVSRTTSIEY